jgi:hypothetical protein
MLERSLARTFANLSTLILVAFVITMPVHLAHAFMFSDALAVQELAPEISEFPEGRQVRGVAKSDLRDERTFLYLALALELLSLPLVYRAARRVLATDDDGGVAGVLDSWRNLEGLARTEPIPVLVASLVGGIAALLIWSIGARLADMASADFAWVLFGLGRATAVAVFMAFVTGAAAAWARDGAPAPKPVEKLDLY